MKPGAITSALFALTALGVTLVSGSMMELGFWSMAIIGVAVIVAASPYLPVLMPIAKGLAVLAGVLSVLAVVFGLLAATTGGSFRLPSDQGLLLFLLFIFGALGFTFGKT